ncbi:malonate decarboxylase holo-ACP synthase [Paraburkholderia sp. A2WS-5]|uniref:malonate decarboxylase holo-ACP synthase n=1 Tax=unclassified Paraburkholderia TaxID=2615204 RepID=UPI003B81EF72
MRPCAAPPFAPDTPCTDESRWRPHDLLRLARLAPVPDEPTWVPEAFARAPFAVVRRAQAAPGFVAAGLRGGTRAERFGTWVNAEDIESSVSPESLLAIAPSPERVALAAFVALASLREAPGPLRDFVWGPTGSAGFELATQVHTPTESSDLDLLIRMPRRSNAATIAALAATLARAAQHAGTRVDAQLETPAGGVALAELAQWTSGKARVLARASDGARLVADPWQTS